jgi:hypothetical protein
LQTAPTDSRLRDSGHSKRHYPAAITNTGRAGLIEGNKEKEMHLAFAAAVAVTLGAAPAFADESGDPLDAIATMAAARVCKISVSEEAKRVLYGEILSNPPRPNMKLALK